MNEHKVYRAIGLMSGTSLDGAIDVALIETDGHDYVRPLRYMAHPYDIEIRDKVRLCFGKTSRDDLIDEAENLVTRAHIDAVKAFGESADIIGFHGQTITHNPDNGFTWQIGNAQDLAREVGINVVADMRQADIRAGGQGAPLLPLYHQALLSSHAKPVAVLNLGGVANITYIDKNLHNPNPSSQHSSSSHNSAITSRHPATPSRHPATPSRHPATPSHHPATPSRHPATPSRHPRAGGDLIAFDCGTASALMDDFMLKRTGKPFDKGGELASQGVVDDKIAEEFLSHPYFAKPAPKSLDRDVWSIAMVEHLSDANGMATLLAMSVMGVARAIELLPAKPAHIYVAGGGRNNHFMMNRLAIALNIKVAPIDDLGWNGDATEGEGFAYLAVRSLLGLPLSLPSTTGVLAPITGGVLYKA